MERRQAEDEMPIMMDDNNNNGGIVRRWEIREMGDRGRLIN